MMLFTKTFQRQFKHAKSMKTHMSMFGSDNDVGGSRAIVQFYSSWSICKSLYEELSAPTLANNSISRHLKPSLINDAHAQLTLPSLMLPSIKDKATGDMVYRFFNPVDNKIVRIKKSMNSLLPNSARYFWSSQGWLAFIDRSDCGLYLWNPSSNDVIQLPSIESLPPISGVIRKDDGSIKRFIQQEIAECDFYSQITPKMLSESFMTKFCLSIAPSSSMDNSNPIVMAIQDDLFNLAFCKPGGTAWTALDGPLRPYDSVIPSQIDKVFYAMAWSDEIEAWDLRDLSSIKRTLIHNKYNIRVPTFAFRFLIESAGDLLLVIKYMAHRGVAKNGAMVDELPYKTLRFDVYKFNFSQGKWDYVKCLGDRALFVGWSNSFSVPASEYPGLKPNSIYFADNHAAIMSTKLYHYAGHDMGVFNLEDNNIEQFYPFGQLKKIVPTPFWVAPSNPHSSNGT